MPKPYGHVCSSKGKRLRRGDRFLKITRNGSVFDVTRQFTGRPAKDARRKKPKTKKRKSTSNYGRKRRGPLKGFVSLKQKRAAMRALRIANKKR